MAILHHPDLSSLMSCAAGSQPEAMAAVMSSHLAMCPRCRREVRRMQEIGVALFEKLPSTSMSGGAPVVAARAAEADDLALPTSHNPRSVGDVPYPIAGVVGADLDDIPWKRLAPGVWHHQIRLSERAAGDLRLLKVAPGAQLPEHGHGGGELTLVLRGAYSDSLGRFSAGDVADLDDDVEHQPVACPKEGCICLVATDGKARFKGLVARLLQPIFGV